jgi:hypothetical protein
VCEEEEEEEEIAVVWVQVSQWLQWLRQCQVDDGYATRSKRSALLVTRRGGKWCDNGHQGLKVSMG